MMEFSTICFVFEVPPVKSYFSRYDFKLFIEKGKRVIVCDISRILHPKMYSKIKENELIETSDFVNVIHFEIKKEFCKFVESTMNSFFWLTIPITPNTVWCIRKISKKRYGYICNVDYVPLSFLNTSRAGYWTTWSIGRFVRALVARIPRFVLGIRNADSVITYSDGLEKQTKHNTACGKNTKKYLTNSIDYCECIKSLKQVGDKLVDGPYLVFLDQYLPYHPDGREAGYCLNPEEYYTEINRFLHRISELTKLKIVVAAHPKANYFSEHNDAYEDALIFQYKTAELVKDASLVISHYSLSLNFSIFFEKPLILIHTNGMLQNKGVFQQNMQMGESISRSFINISDEINDEKIKEILLDEMNNSRVKYGAVVERVKLPIDHPNSKKMFGEVMWEAM